MKSIFFLGGGPLSVPAINWAKEIGFHIIVNDISSDAEGFNHADVKLNYDSTDINNISLWVLRNNEKYNIHSFFCNNDFGLLTANVLHQILGLKAPSINSTLNGLDKLLMKKCWEKTIINFPKSIVLHSKSFEDLFDLKFNFPIVVKPTSSSGSSGVSIINNENLLKGAYQEARSFSNNGTVLFEEFIDGSHHDVNGFFWEGNFYNGGIGDRFFTDPPHPVPKYGIYPSELDQKTQNILYNFLEEGSKSMGILHGPVKGDFVYDIKNDKVFVYEITPRFHGDIFTTNMQSFLESKNPIYQLLSFIFKSGNHNYKKVNSSKTYGGWRVISNNLDNIKKLNYKGIWLSEKNKGKEIKNLKNNHDIHGLVWFEGKSRYEVIDKMGI